MNGRVEHLRGGLIVSYQALPEESLHSSFIIGRMVLAAKESGAAGIQANTKEGTAEIQKQMDLPVIGIVERDYEDGKVYTTLTMREIRELVKVKLEITVLDVISDLRPGARSLDEFYREIRAVYPGQLLMADCSTVKEVLYADQSGFDFIGTTPVGYAKQSRGLKIESDDLSIIREIMTKVKHGVIAEGNINIPEKARRVIELGVFSVVVGSITIRPQLITRSFTQAIEAEG